MNRRSWLMVATASVALIATACSGKSVPSSVSVSSAKLQEMVAKRFPKQFPVAGLLQLSLTSPTLAMLPERNALNALIPVELGGKVLKEAYSGTLNVDFALRYEPTDRTLRAHQIKVNSLEMNGLAPAMSDMLATYTNALAEQALGQVVLYQLQDKDLALVDALAMEPGAITVTPQGLTIALVQKASSGKR
ncbi:DUF1439 domain-containing protein [Comamonas sp. lk]|uniref:DUF1439 domain-containing protein n=1 Tax=Comamonas sp. lk TaxID=2201272 RepID=UPI001F08A646|nr:DUF1439 domain-containing protein [Comamonas sp. lk]